MKSSSTQLSSSHQDCISMASASIDTCLFSIDAEMRVAQEGYLLVIDNQKLDHVDLLGKLKNQELSIQDMMKGLGISIETYDLNQTEWKALEIVIVKKLTQHINQESKHLRRTTGKVIDGVMRGRS